MADPVPNRRASIPDEAGGVDRDTWLDPLSSSERELIDGLAEHDRRVAADEQAQRLARRVAEEVQSLAAYAIAEGDAAGLERIAERLGTVAMGAAIEAARARKPPTR